MPDEKVEDTREARLRALVHQVLSSECSSRCMDDEEDRLATTNAIVSALLKEG